MTAHEPGVIVYQQRIQGDSTWLLTEHRLRNGRGVLPGTAYVELLRAVCADLTKAPAVDITQLTFIAPFGLAAGEARQLRVTAHPLDDGRWDVDIESLPDGGSHSSSSWDEHAHATIAAASSPIAATPNSFAALRARIGEPIASGGPWDVPSRQSAHIAFGPRWSVVREAARGRGEAIAALALDPSYQADFATVPAHPALLDFATAIGLAASRDYEHSTDLYVPLAYRRIAIGSLANAAWSHARVTSEPDDKSVALDVDIYDAEGRVLARVEELVMRRVAPQALAATSAGTAAASAPAATTTATATQPRPPPLRRPPCRTRRAPATGRRCWRGLSNAASVPRADRKRSIASSARTSGRSSSSRQSTLRRCGVQPGHRSPVPRRRRARPLVRSRLA